MGLDHPCLHRRGGSAAHATLSLRLLAAVLLLAAGVAPSAAALVNPKPPVWSPAQQMDTYRGLCRDQGAAGCARTTVQTLQGLASRPDTCVVHLPELRQALKALPARTGPWEVFFRAALGACAAGAAGRACRQAAFAKLLQPGVSKPQLPAWAAREGMADAVVWYLLPFCRDLCGTLSTGTCGGASCRMAFGPYMETVCSPP